MFYACATLYWSSAETRRVMFLSLTSLITNSFFKMNYFIKEDNLSPQKLSKCNKSKLLYLFDLSYKYPKRITQFISHHFPSASNFNSAALDRAASPAKASPRFTLLDHAEAPFSCAEVPSPVIFLESGVTVFAVAVAVAPMPRRDRLCKTDDGDAKCFGSCCGGGGCCSSSGFFVVDSERLH